MKTKTTTQRANRKISTTLKVLISLFLIMIACLVVGGILIAISMPTILEEKYLKEFLVNETKTFDGVTSLNINSVSTDVTFFESSDNEVKVVFQGFVKGNENMKMPTLFTEQDGGRLKIEVKYPDNLFNFGTITEDTSLDIYLPKDFDGDIKTDTVSGDIKIENKNLTSFEINSVSGDLYAKDLKTGSFKSSIISGNSIISGVLGKTELESVSGDLNIEEQKINGDLKLDTISGNVAIAFFNDPSVNLEYQTVSGNLNQRLFDNTKPDISPGEKKYTATKNGGTYDVRVTTVSGDLDIS